MQSLRSALFVFLLGWPSLTPAATIPVNPGQSIQVAIDSAMDGDVVAIAAGTFSGDIDFRGKAITVAGVGPETVIAGTGTGPVVRLSSNEPPEAMLDSVTITGGASGLGGGIYISGSSPTILHSVIIGNSARFQGSGVFIGSGASPQLLNNLILYNSTAQNDPHSVEIVDAAPILLNNTIARGDSNGIILRGSSAALIMSNMVIYNGSVTGGRRGRGICDFSGGLARIHYNLFARNRIGALLTNGEDFRRISRAQTEIGAPRLKGNIDGPARLAARISRDPTRVSVSDFRLRTNGGAPARDAGNPDRAYDDVDGSRNDIGVGGGPLAPEWAR